MQTATDDPRVKLMQKWSQNMPAYGMSGTTLRAATRGDDDDDDDVNADARSTVSKSSMRSVSSMFISGSSMHDIHRAKAQIRGARTTIGKTNPRRNRNNRSNNGNHTTSNTQNTTNSNKGKSRQKKIIVYKKKPPKNSVFIEDLKDVSVAEFHERREHLAEYTGAFHKAMVSKKQELRPDETSTSFQQFVAKVDRFGGMSVEDVTAANNLLEEIYNGIDSVQKKLMLDELKFKAKAKNPGIDESTIKLPNRANLYVKLPNQITDEEFTAKTEHENGKEKFLLNLYCSMLTVIVTYKRHKTIDAKTRENLTKKNKADQIPAYKTNQEDDPNFKWYLNALEDIKSLKNTWETYNKHIYSTNTDKKITHGQEFHFFKPIDHGKSSTALAKQ
jgi:hypothetical protein